MNFTDLDSAIAWAKDKVAPDMLDRIEARFLVALKRHGQSANIEAGLYVSRGEAANQAYLGSPAVDPSPGVWLRVSWSDRDGRIAYRMPMERSPTDEELQQFGASWW